MGIWGKFGEIFIQKHVFFFFFLFLFFFFLTVLFGDFELVRDSQNPSDKETFFCFLPRFLHIQILTCDGIAWH